MREHRNSGVRRERERKLERERESYRQRDLEKERELESEALVEGVAEGKLTPENETIGI